LLPSKGAYATMSLPLPTAPELLLADRMLLIST